jgi:hypothetical protein
MFARRPPLEMAVDKTGRMRPAIGATQMRAPGDAAAFG